MKKQNGLILLGIVIVGLWFVLNETDSDGNTIEQQLATVLGQIEGVGQVSVFIFEQQPDMGLFATQQGEIGVLVVAEGAHSPTVKRQLEDTVKRVLQIASHRIAILPMEEGEQE